MESKIAVSPYIFTFMLIHPPYLQIPPNFILLITIIRYIPLMRLYVIYIQFYVINMHVDDVLGIIALTYPAKYYSFFVLKSCKIWIL